VAEGGRAVAEMVRDYADEDKRRRLVEKIGEIERSADKVTYETVSLLHTTFITPFDRDDIHRLISTMDDILDLIQDAAESVQLFDIQTMPPDAPRLASLLEDCCQHVKEAVELLSSMDNAPRALALAQKIDGSKATPMPSCAPVSHACSARSRTCGS
jgi:predicted phosphate transport protein (TIGR00153 family)